MVHCLSASLKDLRWVLMPKWNFCSPKSPIKTPKARGQIELWGRGRVNRFQIGQHQKYGNFGHFIFILGDPAVSISIRLLRQNHTTSSGRIRATSWFLVSRLRFNTCHKPRLCLPMARSHVSSRATHNSIYSMLLLRTTCRSPYCFVPWRQRQLKCTTVSSTTLGE